MHPELTLILVLVGLIIGAILVRRGGMWQRCVFDAVAFLVVSGVLFNRAISPLSRPVGATPQAVDLLGVLLTAWWILCAIGAATFVETVEVVLRPFGGSDFYRHHFHHPQLSV